MTELLQFREVARKFGWVPLQDKPTRHDRRPSMKVGHAHWTDNPAAGSVALSCCKNFLLLCWFALRAATVWREPCSAIRAARARRHIFAVPLTQKRSIDFIDLRHRGFVGCSGIASGPRRTGTTLSKRLSYASSHLNRALPAQTRPPIFKGFFAIFWQTGLDHGHAAICRMIRIWEPSWSQ